MAIISFHIKDNAPPGGAGINLLQNAGASWTVLGGTDAQGNDFLFDLEPRPSNVAGNVLDGRIDVLAPAVANVQTTENTSLVQTAVVNAVAGDAMVRLPVSSQKDDGGRMKDEVSAAALRSPVNNLMASISSQTADTAAQAGLPSGTATETMWTEIGEPQLGWLSQELSSPSPVDAGVAEAFSGAFEVKTMVADNGLDDFFRRYPADVVDGSIDVAARCSRCRRLV